MTQQIPPQSGPQTPPTQQSGFGQQQSPPPGAMPEGGGGQPTQQPQQQGQPGQELRQPAEAIQQIGPGADVKLEDALTDEMRVALHDFVQSVTVCEWCADRCIDEGPEMSECLRLCRDVADLAALNVQLIARDSIFGPEAAEVFANAAEACAQECAQYPHRHCQECADVLSRAVESTRNMLASFTQTGQQMQSTQGQFQQPTGAGQPTSQYY